MLEEDNISITKKKYVHRCTLPKSAEAIDEILPDDNCFKKKFRKFCLTSWHVSHRQIYAKSNKMLDKERKIHLLNHYRLIHPFSDFSYYWGIMMIIINLLQLIAAPIIIILRLKMEIFHLLIFGTQLIGNVNIIVQFNTGYYRYDIKQVVYDRSIIAKHYVKTFFIFDLIGNFPFRIFLQIFKVDIGTIVIFKLAIACNAGNFIKSLESLREKRDLDLVIVRLLASFAITAFGLLWITAFASIAAHLDNTTCKASLWWLLYSNFTLLAGTTINTITMGGFGIICQIIGLSFGFAMRNIILVQLILFFKSYVVNRLKKTRLMLELNEFCYLKKLPHQLKTKIFNYYEFKFQDVYYNEVDIWTLLSESMRQNMLDYDAKQWFEGDIFKLCPLVLRQMISINLDKEIYLKDDVIYLSADPVSRVYFIKTGTVVFYDKDDNMAHQIEEGNFFSEKALYLEDELSHAFKAVAQENCQLFSLKREIFQKLIKSFPDEHNLILDILNRRKQFILKSKRIKRQLILSDYYPGSATHDEF